MKSEPSRRRCIEQRFLLDRRPARADAIAREGRAKASEDAEPRRETETSFAQRRRRPSRDGRRLARARILINRQLQSVSKRTLVAANNRSWFRQKTAALDAQRTNSPPAAAGRDELRPSPISLSEARAHFLKEIEMESLQDASALPRI